MRRITTQEPFEHAGPQFKRQDWAGVGDAENNLRLVLL